MKTDGHLGLCHLKGEAGDAANLTAVLTPQIRRDMRRRAAVEPVIGHVKNEHRMDRNYLQHRDGDANNAILAAVGYNFSLLLWWLRLLLRLIRAALVTTLYARPALPPTIKSATP